MIDLTECIKKGGWKDFREEISKYNPSLAKIIDQIDPSDAFSIYRIKYSYGDAIAKNGSLVLPNSDNTVINAIQDDLDYAAFPLALQGNGCSEIKMVPSSGSRSLNIFNPGDFFGLYEVLAVVNGLFEFPGGWDVYAGLASVCLLGKISNAIKYRKLALKYQLDVAPPDSLLTQYKVIQDIGKNSPWHSSLFLFSKSWVEMLKKDQWVTLLNYLYRASWVQSGNARNDSRFSTFWHNERYSLETNIMFMHMMMIGFGYNPGMKVVNNDEQLLPARFIERAFIEVYGIDYAPIIMGATFLGRQFKHGEDCVYYSSAFDTVQASSNKRASANLSPKEFMRLESLLRNSTIFRASKPNGTKKRIGEFDSDYFKIIGFNNLHLRMFHSSSSANDGLLFYGSEDLVDFDDQVNMLLTGRLKGLNLPPLNVFFHSCTQITATARFKN